MTHEQLAELAQLNAQIAADPANNRARMKRGMLRAKLGADVEDLVEDCEFLAARPAALHSSQLVGMGRSRLRSARRKENVNPENWTRAMGAACLLLALKQQPDADKWVSRATIIKICQMDDGEAMWQAFEDGTDEDEDETPEMWRTLALVFAVCHNMSIAAGVASRALEIEIDEGLWPDWQAGVPERITDHKLSMHEQWGWLYLWVETAPNDLNRLMQRASWFQNQGRHRDALKDFDRAIELQPAEPKWWERRGAHRRNRPFDEKNPIALIFADYAGALRARLKAGKTDLSEVLPARGDALMCNAARDSNHAFRAHACYSLALEKRTDARLYLRRAATMEFCGGGQNAHSSAERAESYADWTRALALDANLDKARAGIVKYLAQTLARPTAHERMEALLDARQDLMQGGVAASLASAIVGEVERTLAT